MSKLSGLQKEVLRVYRYVLREAIRKDRNHRASGSFPFLISSPDSSLSYAAQEFKRQAATVPRSDFKRVEYMIRKAEKQLKLLKMPGVSLVSKAN